MKRQMIFYWLYITNKTGCCSFKDECVLSICKRKLVYSWEVEIAQNFTAVAKHLSYYMSPITQTQGQVLITKIFYKRGGFNWFLP